MTLARFGTWCAISWFGFASVVSGNAIDSVSGTDVIMRTGFESGECVGLACAQVICPVPGQTTRVTGVAYAPNGTLPLPDMAVFVPNGPLEPFAPGATCTRCEAPVSGRPLVLTKSGADGSFTLDNVPAGTAFPLVVQTGRWRRRVTLPAVAACTTTALGSGDTRLPRNGADGDMPLIAIATGAADSLECLVRKAGIDDSAFSIAGGAGRVHLFAGNGTDAFDAAHGGQNFSTAVSLWSSATNLRAYDQVMLACEGAQNPGQKPPATLQAMKAYADLGGRVSFAHWHNYWIQAGPTPWNAIATWNFLPDLPPFTADVNTTFPRGFLLANWLERTGATSTVGTVPFPFSDHTATAVDESMTRKWIFKNVTANNMPTIQYFTFNTPVGSPPAQHCGRVLFTDLHASTGDSSSPTLAFPSGGCSTPVTSLSPNEKVLLFALFDLGTCIDSTIE